MTFLMPELITPSLHKDERGYFSVLFHEDILAQKYHFHLHQINEAHSVYGVIRGLHAQHPPFAQGKIIQVLKGKIVDVVIDIREDSLEKGRVISTILSERQRQLFFIPKGFLHGYGVLSKSARVRYWVDAPYEPKHEIGVRFDDPFLNINWMIEPEKRITSKKDRAFPLWQDLFP